MTEKEYEKVMKVAYQLVYQDMVVNAGVGMFIGKHDAKHGSKEFMYGIGTVMEFIASKVSEETYDTFSNIFTKNLIESEKRVDK